MTPTRLAIALLLLASHAVAAPLAVQFEDGFPERPQRRLLAILAAGTPEGVRLLAPDQPASAAPDGADLLALGDTAVARALIPDPQVARLPGDAFILKTGEVAAHRVLAARGTPPALVSTHLGQGRSGVLFGAYAALEAMGCAFLRPLAPVVPARLAWPTSPLDRTEAPALPVRGLHLHTAHPTELCDVLNGWGPNGPADAAGWEADLPLWESFLEWCAANRVNAVQWVLLQHRRWMDFAQSPERQKRLARLVSLAHAWGVAAGADVPLALEQQNTFRLIQHTGALADEQAQIRANSDWLLAAGFDFMSTELGFSEFTSPDDRRMVAWLDALTQHVSGTRGKDVTCKAHVSTGQVAKHYPDPRTGQPINFNFLAHYADPRCGVLVHTVQAYALDDPAPTYGRKDFADLGAFLHFEKGSRPTYWFPESAYWVTHDIDVPLFLPVYAARRFHDLRLVAQGDPGHQVRGQVVFSSGWEWGYWLGDVVAARAAWNPRLAQGDEAAALFELLTEAFAGLGAAAAPAARALVTLSDAQHDALILGRVNGAAPAQIQKRNALAYLQGVDTWDDVNDLLAKIPGIRSIETQPRRVGLLEVDGPLVRPRYEKEVRPLLARAEELQAAGYAALAAVPAPAGPARAVLDDLVDAAHLTTLRARQVLALYDRASDYRKDDLAFKAKRLADARDALDEAMALVRQREAGYAIPAPRVCGWGPNPTCYQFRYLWSAHTLAYWWRDEGKVTQRHRSPCYLNVIHPAEVATGEGSDSPLFHKIELVVKLLGPITSWADGCLHPPTAEPDLPRLVRP